MKTHQKNRGEMVPFLGGQNFEGKKQQSNRSWRPQWDGCWRGGTAGVEHVGGRYCFHLGGDLNDEKNNIIIHLGLRWPSTNYFTHNNQPNKIRDGIE